MAAPPHSSSSIRNPSGLDPFIVVVLGSPKRRTPIRWRTIIGPRIGELSWRAARAGWWMVRRSGQRACCAGGFMPASQFSNNGPPNRDLSWEILKRLRPRSTTSAAARTGTSTAVSCGCCRYVLLAGFHFPSAFQVRPARARSCPNGGIRTHKHGSRISSRSQVPLRAPSSEPRAADPRSNTDRLELTIGSSQ